MTKKYDKYIEKLGPLFASVEPLPSLVVHEDGTIGRHLGATHERPVMREFLLFRCRGFKGNLAE